MYTRRRSVLFPLITGLLYYLGAYAGLHFAALESGILILWPPNAVLLAALLSRSPRAWWPLLVAVVIADVIAGIAAFTLTQSLLFAAINITECLLAACLIRYFLGAEIDWHKPKDLSVFLGTVFAVASPIATVGGVIFYTQLVASDGPFVVIWRLWWIGDATALISLTPLFHLLFSTGIPRAMPKGPRSRQVELYIAWAVGLVACYLVFFWGLRSEDYLALPPLAVILAPIWVAARFGCFASALLAAAVVLYVSFATVAGGGPFVSENQQQTALLTQEFVVLFIVIVLYIAAFMHQNRKKSHELRSALAEVKELNDALEHRVRQRTGELSNANRRLQALASTDELTGVPNRRAIRKLGEEAANQSSRSQRPFSVMMLDIDRFKSVNDRYGHDVGDRCLQAFAQAVDGALRSVDRFGRWGGEEFIIIVHDSDRVDLVRLCEKLLDSVRNVVVQAGDQRITFTVSIGVAEWHGVSFGRLVSEADDALYRAKEQGRDRAEFYPTASTGATTQVDLTPEPPAGFISKADPVIPDGEYQHGAGDER